MARTFRRKRESAPISELNVTNLIDLGFTLLIIFMIATPLINQEQTIPIELPFESRSEQQQPDPDTVFATLSILADGTVVLDNTPVTIADLPDALEPYASRSPQPVFRLRMDSDTTAQHFTSVMDALKSQRLFRFTIDTQVAN